MNTAVLIGEGPEARAVLARIDLLPENLILFQTNLSETTSENAHLPILDLVYPMRARRELFDQNVSRIILVGSLKLANAEVEGGMKFRLLIDRIGNSRNISDSIKTYIYDSLANFEFSPVKAVLPFLFVTEEVGVNAKPELLVKALEESSPLDGCVLVNLAGESAKIFRVAGNRPVNLFNCCLTPEKLRSLHQRKSVKRFFFDRNRTIIVDYDDMAAYAREHQLTLQSFTC